MATPGLTKCHFDHQDHMAGTKSCILACSLGTVVVGAALLQQNFKKLRVPDGYFLPLQNQVHTAALATKEHCSLACLLDANCSAYQLRDGLGGCTLGSLNTTQPHVPGYVMEGEDLMVKSDRVEFDYWEEPHIGYLPAGETGMFGIAVNATRIPARVAMPEVPRQPGGNNVFGMVGFKQGLIVCGGYPQGVIVKKCWRWSFHDSSGSWREMPGELEEGHFGGQLVVVERRLWMFMGAPVYATNVGHKAVESYGTDQRGWIREPDADVEVGVYVLGAAVFDGTKVLLVGGYSSGYYGHTYVFDSASGSYARKSDLHSPHGFGSMGCAVKPQDDNIVMCLGGINTPEYINNEWEAEDDALDRLPDAATGSCQLLAADDGELYALPHPGKVYRYVGAGSGDSSSSWLTVADVDSSRGDRNFAYSMKYHRLLET